MSLLALVIELFRSVIAFESTVQSQSLVVIFDYKFLCSDWIIDFAVRTDVDAVEYHLRYAIVGWALIVVAFRHYPTAAFVVDAKK